MKRSETMYFSSRRVWLLLFALLLVCGETVLWLFYGTLETTAVCRGVFATKEDCRTLHQRYDGYVTDIYCAKNDYVKKNEAVLSVYPCPPGAKKVSLEEMRSNSIDIKADISGYIADIMVKKWDRISVETPIVKMLNAYNRDLNIVVTAVSADSSTMRYIQEVKTEARVYVKTQAEEEFGYISGTVIGISSLAEGFEAVYEKVGSKTAARYLAGTGESGNEARPVYLVYLLLKTDRETHEVLFSKKQPYSHLRPFEECTVILLLDEQKPYERIFSRGRRVK